MVIMSVVLALPLAVAGLVSSPIAPGIVLPAVAADLQDATVVEADFQELETAARVQDWDTTSNLADKTLRDFRGFMKASRISELSDVERALAGALAHLRDIEESAGADSQREAEHDWKDFQQNYKKLKDSNGKGAQNINSSPVDARVGALKSALDSKDWGKARSAAAEARKALKEAFPAGVLDPLREKIGACETHLGDVREATDQRISPEIGADSKRAKAEWESVRGQMQK